MPSPSSDLKTRHICHGFFPYKTVSVRGTRAKKAGHPEESENAGVISGAVMFIGSRADGEGPRGRSSAFALDYPSTSCHACLLEGDAICVGEVLRRASPASG